ncbi:GNAT family N-acetyltransferase, partial [Kitasatospora sp. NPDC059747]|uniref:GNAT family N-acetyltransferase n=1 Tax=Kitasatospora sp. NPDC059747 TaxID=3346930 RepID=UPI0036497D62
MVTIETPRLILRRWREEDVAPMAAINADPEVMRWIAEGRPRGGAAARPITPPGEPRGGGGGFGRGAGEGGGAR